MKLHRLIALLIALLLLASLNLGCGGGVHSPTTTTKTTAPPSISSLGVSPVSVSIGVGATQQLVATAHLSDGTTSDMSTSVAWTSSDPSVASIDAKGLATGYAAGAVTINAQTGTLHATARLDVTAAPTNLESITISPAASSMPVNTSLQFTATGIYSDGSSSDLTKVVSWSSSSPTIVTINALGSANALTAGATNISAQLSGIKQTTALAVNAPSIASIAVTPVSLTLGIGIHQQFVATATYTDGTSSDLISGVTWGSSSPSIATVNSSGMAQTVASGPTTITATFGSFSDSTSLTVVPAHLTSISVSTGNSSIALGTTEQLSAVGSFDDGSTQPLTSLTWSSSSNSVATVDSEGLVTAIGMGSTTITASSGEVTETLALTVTEASLISIALAPANSTMAIGTTTQLTAIGSFSDSSTQDISDTVMWSSSNPAAATVGNTGLATGLAAGSTTISAAVGTISGSAGLSVSTAHVVEISINPTNSHIEAHTAVKFAATATFSDGSTSKNLAEVKWRSSKPSVASIRAGGIIHGKKVGSVTITASVSGVTGTTALTVGTGTLISLTIAPTDSACSVGGTKELAAVGKFSDGSTQDITLNSHWSSSSMSVATIANGPNGAGQAQCLGTGSSAMGANTHGIAGSAVLTVQ